MGVGNLGVLGLICKVFCLSLGLYGSFMFIMLVMNVEVQVNRYLGVA